MFFFFFGEIGELEHNDIVKSAFEKIMFEKLQSEGYCDINPLIGRPRISKYEIKNNLKKLDSPLAKVFAGKYAKDTEELEKIMLPVLKELAEKLSKNKYQLDEYDYFAVIYFIFQMYKSVDKKLDCVKKLYTTWDRKKHDIEMSNGIVFDATMVKVNFISSINQYVDFLGQIRKKEGKLFFRGHSKVSYNLKPSLFRKEEWLLNERKMYLELMAKCPLEFERLESHVEKLAKMQHYGLPTRLLDVTQNPLVALYFACESQHSYYGEIIVFSQSLDSVKYFQSDTVAMLASLPLFTKDEQMQFYHSSLGTSSNENDFKAKIERLVHEVRMERPGFKSEIRAEDIRDAVVCIPARKNRRIDNQEGAFIVCGLLEETYGDKKYNTLSNLRLKLDNNKITICIIYNKADLLNELESLGINKAKIYPEIDDVADYIKTHVNTTM
ncbi:FRG domain-containing protein [Anaerovibrio sp.]|uniref:FRG domain-containing protein n=1 Tax=Anaerovibrio sp. TaxID=1872532 RepID=UPI003F18593B